MTAASTFSLPWTPHPLVDVEAPPLTDDEIRRLGAQPDGDKLVFAYWKNRRDRIAASDEDPLQRGFDLPFWKDIREYGARRDEIYIFGGNGSAKSELLCRLACETLRDKRGAKVLMIASDEMASKQYQQSGVYKYTPAALKARNEANMPKKRHFITRLNYSQAGGFTEATCVWPTRSQIWFKTVAQWLKNKEENTSFEGPEYDAIPIDEGCPIQLLDTLSYRAGKRAGKIWYAMTPVNGYDSVCGRVLTGAKVLRSLPMNWDWFLNAPNPAIVIPELDMNEVQVEGCPAGHMPYIVQPLNPAQIVFFIWTHWNPFLPKSQDNPAVPKLFEKCRGKGKVRTRIRLFGYATKVTTCQFPSFDPSVHVYPSDYMPSGPTEGTDYMSEDPAIARSNFALWARVDRRKRIFIVDEFPRYEQDGEWASDEGKRGEAQTMFSELNVRDYKALFRTREAEEGWDCEGRRKGDPRGFAAQNETAEGKKELFDIYDDTDPFEPDNPLYRPMYFEPAIVKGRVNLEIEVINNYLAFNMDRPLSAQNEPRLFIHRRCQNLIRALVNWRPKPGANGLLKDDTDPNCEPIDCLRYLLDRELYFLDPNVPEVVGGGGWG